MLGWLGFPPPATLDWVYQGLNSEVNPSVEKCAWLSLPANVRVMC